MEDLASLGFRVDSSGIKGATRELGRMDKASGQAERSTKGLSSASMSLSSALAGVAAVIGSAGLVRSIYGTVKSTQVLQASLKTVTGSTESATAAWSDLLDFAKTTPFTLDQSVKGFIRMKSLGLDPTEKALKSFGNTSAAMGKDLMQMIEAVADASTGEFERLKEFGIRASKQGDDITFTFQGVETTVRNSATAISGYLEGIGSTQFAGAMADQMDTLSGQASNLEDSVDALYRAIGEAGATDAFEASIDAAASTVETLTENVDILKAAFSGLVGAAATLTAIAVATRAATVAQWAFNTAAKANPYVFLATTLGAAAAAIYSLSDSMDPAIERSQLLKTAIGDLTDSLDLLTRSELENRKASFAQDMIESRAEAEKLGASLETLQDIIRNSGQLTPQGGAMQIATTEDINRARALKAQIDELSLSADASAGAIEDVNALIESLGKNSKDTAIDVEGLAGASSNAAAKIISALQDEYLQLTLNEEQLLRHKLASEGASVSQIVLAGDILKASRAIEEQRKQEDALSEMRREFDPAFAEFDRYADQIDAIESFNISTREKEILREGQFRIHQENMADIAERGSEDQRAINREASAISESLMLEEESIIASYERRRDIILANTEITGNAQNRLLTRLENEKNDKLGELNASYWQKYMAAAEENLQNFDELSKTVIDNFTTSFGSAFESIVFDFESLDDALHALSETILRTVVNSLGQMAAQFAVTQALKMAGIGAETQAVVASEATKAAASVAGTAVATTASVAATATTTATQVASAGAVASAWLPAALVASIGSFGAAAVVGGTALLAAYALIGGFQAGGYTGNGGEGEVAGVVHGKEFVMNAAATKRIGAGNLEKMSRGESVPASNAQSGGGEAAQSAPTGIQVTNVFNISPGLSGAINSEIQKSMPALKEMSKRAVLEAINSGGAMSRATGRRS